MKWSGSQDANGFQIQNVRYELVASVPAPWVDAWEGRPVFVVTPGPTYGPWVGDKGSGTFRRPSGYGATSIEVAKNGVLIGTRKRLNLKEGANITLNVVDDPPNDKVDAEIVAAGGG